MLVLLPVLCSGQNIISNDSLVSIARGVSQWFGPDFDLSSAVGSVQGPVKFETADGRPEVQEHDAQNYYEVTFRSPADSQGFLSKVFIWDDGIPAEVLFSNGFGRDFFVDTYSDLRKEGISVPYPFTNLFYHFPVSVESNLFQFVNPDDVDRIMHSRHKAIEILNDLSPHSFGYGDKPAVEALLNAEPMRIDANRLSSFTRVRSIQVMDGIFIYPYFGCRFTRKDRQWYFRKTSGSQRKSGYLYDNSPESMVFLGGWTVNNNPQTGYGSSNSTAGVLYQLNDDYLIMVFLNPEHYNAFEIYEFKK